MSDVNPTNPLSQLSQKTESLIQVWTREFADTQSMGSDSLQELQNHLVDSLQSLVKLGLSEEEAFLVATKRVGTANDLAAEYAKTESSLWANRALWMCLGYLGISLSLRVSGALSAFAAAVTAYATSSLDQSVPTAITAVSQAVSIGGLLVICVGMWLLARRAHSLKIRLTNRALVGVVLCIVLCTGLLHFGSQAAMAHIITPSDYGRMALSSAYVSYALSLLMPMTFVVLAIKLRAKVALRA